MDKRLAQFREILRQNKLDGFVVTNPTNIFYLTGFRGISPQERESILVFNPKLYPAKSAFGGRSGATLITARLYQNEAKKVACRNLKIKIAPERHELMPDAARLLKGCKRVGFEENDLRFAQYHFLQRSLNKTLMPFADLIENLRTIKSAEELKRIEKAQIISQKAFSQLLKTLKIGQTEEEIADRLSRVTKSLGGQGLAFESIIASGPNSGRPHHVSSNRKIRAGDTLLLDFGAKYQDYMADLSRTVTIGKASDKQRNIYEHVQNAQKASIDKIRSGLKSSEVYHEANNHFKKHGLSRYFLHGLGHGIGLEIHENPYLRPSISNPLKELMVFSIEPGLYFPWGGIRIEDLVTIKGGRAKVLGRQLPDIIEI